VNQIQQIAHAQRPDDAQQASHEKHDRGRNLYKGLKRMLGRLSVGRKLMLIYVLDLCTVTFISGVLIHEKYITIDFSRKESRGVQYVKTLSPALISVARSSPEQDTLKALPEVVAKAERLYGDGMSSAQKAQDWANKLSNQQVQTLEGRQHLLQEGLDLVTLVVNQSNLILDPELGSYYTMSQVMLRYPQLLQLAVQLHQQLLASQTAMQPVPPHANLMVLMGQLNALVRSIDVDRQQAAAALGQKPDDKGDVTFRQLKESITAFQEEVEQASVGANYAPAKIRSRHDALLTALGAAWSHGADDLDNLLQARVRSEFIRMAEHLGAALALQVLVLGGVLMVARRITVPLGQLAGLADSVGKTGDHSLQLTWDSNDEIGRLVSTFNRMLDELAQQRHVQQEMAASARASLAQQQLLDQTPVALLVTSVPDQRVLHANSKAEQWLGDISGDPWLQGMKSETRQRFFQTLADTGKVREFEVLWHDRGVERWVLLSARRLEYQGHDAVLTTFTPISRLKTAELRLELWAKVFEASSEGIALLDSDRRVLSANRALCHAGAITAEGVPSLDTVQLEGRPVTLVESIWYEAARRGWWRGEVEIKQPDGSNLPAWAVVTAVRTAGGHDISHYIFTCLDISDRKSAEDHVRYLAHHDVLTGLPNRAVAEQRLHEATSRSGIPGQQAAVLFVDLDRFKNINDSLGHHIGDEVLRMVARRLSDAVRTSDTVSRFGGDEFVILLNGVSGSPEANMTAQRVMDALRKPYPINAMELNVSCSVGIAMFPSDGTTMTELMRNADAAMYHAKSQGRDTAYFFTSELNQRAQSRLDQEQLLRNAVARDEFQLVFQPQVDAHSGALLCVEALLRWISPKLGAVSPADFIPLAEESGLIVPIGEWVINEACRRMADWQRQGIGIPRVSINLSAVQLGSESLIPALQRALLEHDIDPVYLELELTESTLMEHASDRLTELTRLKSLGVHLSIDDFGTGYSSLSYLSRLPMDKLKIDRSLVKDMLEVPKDRVITEAVIALAHQLNMAVVAEGVETRDLLDALTDAGCDAIQGYFTGRPMSPTALVEWLEQRNSDSAELPDAAVLA
jgi:diguanylate cyclase (GGDEF)-like protein/PAS domain S-box-containing protein